MLKVKSCEQFVIAIFIALNLWIANVYAQDCKPQDFNIGSVSLVLTPGVDVSTDDPLQIKMQLTTAVISHTENPSSIEKYLDISYDDINSRVLVTTTAHFLTYEKDQTNTELVASVVLNCADTRNIVMVVTFVLKDVNNYAPEFSKPSYEIEIPLPLPINFNIFWLITDTISATDYDLQNNKITFTSDITNQPFIVGTSSETPTKGKEFFASIHTTEQIYNIKSDIEFTITATDSGTPNKFSTVNVKITAQFDNSVHIEVPVFSKSIYIGTLDFKQTPSLAIEFISLLGDTFVPSIDFGIESDGGFFQLVRNNLDNAVYLNLKDTVTEDDLNGASQLLFIVTATRLDGIRGHTAVLINVNAPKMSLEFEKVLYTGTIKADMTIDLDPIKITDATLDVVFSIVDDVMGWFDVIQNPNANQMQIELKRPLTVSELSGKTLISLTILAKSTDSTYLDGESHVVLGIEESESTKSLVFENKLYTGLIKADMTIELDPIKLTDATYQLDVDFSIVDDLTGWFDVIQNPNVNQMQIELKRSLTVSELSGKTLVSLTLLAKSAGSTYLDGESHVVLGIEDSEITSSIPPEENEESNECNDTGLVVGIIVIALLLLFVCIAMFFMWWRWIRPFLQRESSNEQLVNDFNVTGYTDPIVTATPIVATSDADTVGVPSYEIKNENTPVEVISEEPYTSPATLNKSLESILDVDDQKDTIELDKEYLAESAETDESTMATPRARKKSIKFNEMVERIDILDDITDKD